MQLLCFSHNTLPCIVVVPLQLVSIAYCVLSFISFRKIVKVARFDDNGCALLRMAVLLRHLPLRAVVVCIVLLHAACILDHSCSVQARMLRCICLRVRHVQELA